MHTNSSQLTMHWNCNWCKLEHAQTCLCYDQKSHDSL